MLLVNGHAEDYMGTHKKEITQRDILDIFVQMKEEDRKKQERAEIIEEYKQEIIEIQQERIEVLQEIIEIQQKRIEEQRKREKSEYIIDLIAQGYALDDAKRMATEKFSF